MSSPSPLELYAGIISLLLVIGTWWWFVPPLLLQQSSFHARRNTPDAFTTRRAYNTYASYRSLAISELKSKQISFKTLRGRYQVLARQLGYSRKLDKLDSSIAVNTIITDAIADLARVEFPAVAGPARQGLWSLLEPPTPQDTDLSRVREALKHFVRDWSAEGQEERNKIFRPILDHLSKIPPHKRQNIHVLVPGSGLGRLAWEISELGFITTANELSYYMNLALRFLLSPETTKTPNQHTVRPFAQWWSHERSSGSIFRPVTFPDAVPRLGGNLRLEEKDFMQVSPPKHAPQGYDFVVTLFFIDTAPNLIATMDHIRYVLKPQGQWLNLGPLLYFSAQVELALDEVLHLARLLRFQVDEESRQTVESEYTADREAMMKYIYQTEFWIATKTGP